MTEVGFEFLYSDGEVHVTWTGIIDDPDPEAAELNELIKKLYETQYTNHVKRRKRLGTITRKIKRQVGEIEYFDD